MKPVRCGRSNPDLFRERLDAIIDMRHGLVRLAGLMPWSDFDESFRLSGRREKKGAALTLTVYSMHGEGAHLRADKTHVENKVRLGEKIEDDKIRGNPMFAPIINMSENNT